MKRSDLIKNIAQDLGVTLTSAKAFVECYEKNIIKALADGNDVALFNFGRLKTKYQDARLVRNPKTGTPVMLKPRTSVSFKPAKLLLEALNKQK